MSADSLHKALRLAEEGKRVFFCRKDKTPACPHGLLDAVSDAAAIRELHKFFPGSLVAFATGEASGVDVLDIDRKHPEAVAWWKENRSRIPATWTCRTRSGGLHLHFIHASRLRNSASRIARGVDTRADGGYVIHWPAAGLPVLCDSPPAAWPAWLLAFAMPKPEARPARRDFPDTPLNDRKLAGLVRLVAQASKGERNCILFWASCRVGEAVRSGDIGEGFGAAVLEEAATQAGLPAIEARRTIASGLRSAAS